MADSSRPTLACLCCAASRRSSGWRRAWRRACGTDAIPSASCTRSRRCCGFGCLRSRRATRTPTIAIRSGEEVGTVLKHVIKRIRRHWPKVDILVRGDSHYGRDEAMEWCEETQGVDYVFGFAGNDVLDALTREAADAIAVQRALWGKDRLRGFKAFRYGAKSWDKERRFVARIEATPKGLDVRYVVTSLKAGARHLYETLYCARGNAENFIKLHKSQLASDRTSCRDPKANQFRLILHTAAYWLMLAMRSAVPKRSPVSTAEFATIRLRLIKIAARVVEGAARIRVYLPTACPDRAVFRALAGRFCAAGP